MSFEDVLHPLLASYYRSPQWLKASVGSAYAKLPVTWRRGSHYPRFQAEAALRDERAIRQLASQKLALTLRHALLHVPAYRAYRGLAAHLDEPEAVLRELPLIDKETIRNNMQDFLAQGVDPKFRLKMSTGGTTSEPVTFYIHKGISRAKESAYIEQFHQRAGMCDRDLVLHLRGFPVPGAGTPGKPLWMVEPIKKQLILSTDHLARAYMEQYVQAIRRWKPRFVLAFASAIYPLALWLHEQPAPDISGSVKGILLFSETVMDHQVELLRRVFPCATLKHYGHSERLLMAASMPGDVRYFFWPQYGHMELVDQTGKPVTEPGEMGEIVGTGYDNMVMPLIRYRTGDMAVLSGTPHPGLPGFPVVERIEGRLQEFIVCSDNRLISVNSLTNLAQDPEMEKADMIQFEQLRPGHLRMKIVAPTELSAQVRARVGRRLMTRAQGGLQLEVIQTESIPRTPRGKQQMLVQHLDMRGYFGTPDSV